MLLLILLAGGLVGLLLLNTASAQDSFRLHALQDQDAALQQQEQALTSLADGLDDPSQLAKRAAELGMVAGDPPVFLPRGVPIPKGAIRVGNLIYAPGVVPVTPPPAAAIPAPKPTVKPAAKKPAVKKPVVKKPVAGAKVPVATVSRAPVATRPTTTATTTTRTPVKTATNPATNPATHPATSPVAGGH